MTRKDPWLERFPQIVLAISTTILAADIVIGWLTGAFNRDSLSGTISAIVLNVSLALIACAATAAAVFYWRKLRESDRWIIDFAARLKQVEEPEGPPIIADVTDPGYPPLSSGQLADLYTEARVRGERTYSDARLCAVTIISVPRERPSIRVEFDFYSQHAAKAAEVHWDNYGGFGHGQVSQNPVLLAKRGGWDKVPWETYPQWERFYRLAYEKVQPLSDPPLVIVTSASADDRTPWVFDFKCEPSSIQYALTADGQLTKTTSVYAARAALAQALRQGFAQRPLALH